MSEEKRFDEPSTSSTYAYDAPMISDFADLSDDSPDYFERNSDDFTPVQEVPEESTNEKKTTTEWLLDAYTAKTPVKIISTKSVNGKADTIRETTLNCVLNDITSAVSKVMRRTPKTKNPKILSTSAEKGDISEPMEYSENVNGKKTSIVNDRRRGRVSVITGHARRRSSIMKRLPRSNRYMSFAESVRKFQTETPPRFRTISSKVSKEKAQELGKKTKKLDEMESQQMMRQKNCPNPVPKDIHQAPRPLAPVAKKSTSTYTPVGNQRKPNAINNSLNKAVANNKIVIPVIVSSEGGLTAVETEIRHFGIPAPKADASAKSKTTTPLPFNFERRKVIETAPSTSNTKRAQVLGEKKQLGRKPEEQKKTRTFLTTAPIVRTRSEERIKATDRLKTAISAGQLETNQDIECGNQENKPPKRQVSKLILKPNPKIVQPVELNAEKLKQMKMAKALREEKRKKEQDEKLTREKLAIKELRKKAEFKATPMPRYDPKSPKVLASKSHSSSDSGANLT